MAHIGETLYLGQYRGKRVRRRAQRSSCELSSAYAEYAMRALPVTTSRLPREMDARRAQVRKSIVSITRHRLERDEGIVCAASDCRTPHRRGGLAPRCRIVASWGCSRSQGLGCSPIKAVRDLGSERRETVRSLSAVGAGDLRRLDPSTRGPGRTNRW